MKKIALLILVGLVFCFATLDHQRDSEGIWATVWQKQKQDFARELELFEGTLHCPIDRSKAQKAFLLLRLQWKKWEPLASYYFPAWSNEINGAPIPKVDENDGTWQSQIQPQGLQVIEELLWSQDLDSSGMREIRSHCQGLRWSLQKLGKIEGLARFAEWQILDALALEMIRIQTLGISGFDTPSSGQNLHESAVALQSSARILAQIATRRPKQEKKQLLTLSKQIQSASVILQTSSPDQFDKGSWIRNCLSPLYTEMRRWQWQAESTALGPSARNRPSSINPRAKTLFDKNFLNVDAFWRGPKPVDSLAAVRLGKMLFEDPALSSNQSLSCASCHQQSLGFADGLPKSRGQNAEVLQRNSPGLKGSFWQKNFFWDGRAKGLNEQMDHVVFSHGEFNTDYLRITAVVQQPLYDSLMDLAFPQSSGLVAKGMVNAALAWYIYSLSAGDNLFAQWMRQEIPTLPTPVHRGANLFMGKALCASCHFAPLWGGLVPPLYEENEFEVLGTPASADLSQPSSDPDLGRGAKLPHRLWQGAFKTPSLINVSKTAPYMHHGAFTRLEDVLELYIEGGGQGLGLDVPNQTLPFDQLELTEQEKSDLLAFLAALAEP